MRGDAGRRTQPALILEVCRRGNQREWYGHCFGYIGLGTGAVCLMTYEITCKCRNDGNGLELIDEEPVNRHGLPGKLLFFRAGLSCQIMGRWSIVLNIMNRIIHWPAMRLPSLCLGIC